MGILVNLRLISPSMVASDPGFQAVKQAQTTVLPPPCFPSGVMFRWQLPVPCLTQYK